MAALWMGLEVLPVGGSSGTQIWVAVPHGVCPVWFCWELEPKLEGVSGFVFAPGQVPADPWRRLLQEGVLRPEVRRYLFYSSRGFQIAMAVVRAPRAARPGTGVLVPTEGLGFGWGANPGSVTFLVGSLGNPSSQNSCGWRARPSLHRLAGTPTRAGCW